MGIQFFESIVAFIEVFIERFINLYASFINSIAGGLG